MPKFKSYNQYQSLLLPPSLADSLPADHICFVINDIVDQLDFSAIEATYSDNGSPAYDPRLLIKVLFYGYSQGLRSSRRIETELYQNIAFRFLAASQQPDHGTISLFRKIHLTGLKEIFSQIAFLSGRLASIDFSDISIDGTKVAASAAKKNNFDQARLDKLKEKFGRFLDEAEAIDEAENRQYGQTRGYNAMPENLINPETRKKAIQKLKEKLAKLKQAEARIKDKQDKAKTKEEKGLKKNSTSNTTDHDANLMKMKDGSFKMGYNAQLAAVKQTIVAYDLNGESTDNSCLKPMVKETEQNLGIKVKTVKADSGYFSKDNLEFCGTKQIDAYVPDKMKSVEEKQERLSQVPPYDRRNFQYDSEKDEFICPQNRRLKLRNINRNGAKRYIGLECGSCPVKGQCTKEKYRNLTYDFGHEKTIRRMRNKLNSEQGKSKYLERMSEIEPVIGNLKRNLQFTHFLCRGKPTALVELGLAATAHNLVKIFNWLKRNSKSRQEIQWNNLMRLRTAQ